ncbi:bifunctional hydroxymethylpyrimidine kinase/phosphomethylpyrimidine kinase [Aquifex sp.]
MTALTIAGFDNSGGAGVLADIKTFHKLGIYGVAVVTALAIQNTQKVYDVFPTPPEKVEKQLRVLLEDFEIKGVKTGMLTSGEIVEVVHRNLKSLDVPLVIDPVLKSKSGKELLDAEGVSKLKEKLIKLAYLITPNVPEAEVLCGEKIESLEDVKKCAKLVHLLGAKNVLIKGGHLKSEKATDILFDGRDFYLFESEKIGKSPRGTGCVFSSAILAYLIKGEPLVESVRRAKAFITEAIKNSQRLGKGYPLMIF